MNGMVKKKIHRMGTILHICTIITKYIRKYKVNHGNLSLKCTPKCYIPYIDQGQDTESQLKRERLTVSARGPANKYFLIVT